MSIKDAHIRLRKEMSDWATSLEHISRNQRDILLVLIKHANLKGLCDPSYETIALTMRVSTRTVKRWMPTLKAEGLVNWRRRYLSHAPGGERLFKERDSNIYKINFPFSSEHLEWQRAGIDKSELHWGSPGRPRKVSTGIVKNKLPAKPVMTKIPAHPKCQNGTGKDNQDNSLVIPETRLPAARLRDYRHGRKEGGEWAALDLQLDWMRSQGVLEVELAGHCVKKNKVVRRKKYWLAAERSQIGRWLGSARRDGLGCFIRPCDLPQHKILMLDDLDACAVSLIAKKWDGLAIETSQGNYQVWLAGEKVMTPELRHKEQQQLIKEYGADPAASGGTQFARAGGTPNTKIGRNAFLTRCQTFSGLDPIPSIVERRSNSGARKIKEIMDENVKRTGICAHKDQSAAEFGWAIAALKAGAGDAFIIKNLSARRVSRKEERGFEDAVRYAERTLDTAKQTISQDY